MKIRTNRLISVSLFAMGLLAVVGTAHGWQLTSTDFEGFAIGEKINGQNGWSATGDWDEEIADDGTGNTVWRVSNARTAGSFGDMPIGPRLGGIVADSTVDPVNGSPGAFAGESQTGTAITRFYKKFDFRSATGAPQADLAISISADNGSGARQTYVQLVDTGAGIDVITFDVDAAGDFVGPITIATGLSYTDWHTVEVELVFVDGLNNDVAQYFVNGALVHTGTSWEEFYRANQAALHPFGVPVQTLLVRLNTAAADPATVLGGGYYIDNVSIEVGNAIVQPEKKKECKDGGWKNFYPPFESKKDCEKFVKSAKGDKHGRHGHDDDDRHGHKHGGSGHD